MSIIEVSKTGYKENDIIHNWAAEYAKRIVDQLESELTQKIEEKVSAEAQERQSADDNINNIIDNNDNTLDEKKADKQTKNGGFVAGENATETLGGVAIGNRASTTSGGAIGSEALSKNGFAGGYHAQTTGMGACIGAASHSYNGGAVGASAQAGNGFAGGNQAKCGTYQNGADIDCIQLGEGTNGQENTLQVYDYQLMNANGKIPVDRLPSNITSSTHTHTNKTVLDGITSDKVTDWDGKATANIKKNPAATDGDIIDTHLTIGYRTGTVGTNSIVAGGNAGYPNEASGNISAVIGGYRNTASANISAVIGGYSNTANGEISAVIGGQINTTSGDYSAVIGGNGNIVEGHRSAVIGGYNNSASGDSSAVIGGDDNTASGDWSAVIGGYRNKANGDSSAVIGGRYNKALANQLKTGHYSKDGIAGNDTGTTGDAFIIGNGTSDNALSNAFRVAYNGSVYGMSAFNSTGADYAEYFEWADGNTDNEDRRGLFVALAEQTIYTATINGVDTELKECKKIKIANADDEIIGVISAVPSIIGNAYDDQWQGMYLTDVFGQPLTHMVHHDAEYIEIEVHDKDEEGNILETTHTEQVVVHEAYDAEEYIINPDYNHEQEYIPRSQRKEWAIVGMFGQIIVTDDGSCTPCGYCTVGENGIATSAEGGWRVLNRVDENHVKILFK